MNRYRPSLLLAVFFCVIAVSTSLAQDAGNIDRSLGQSYRSLQDHRNSAGGGKSAAAPRVGDSRQRLQISARHSGRLRALRPLAALSKTRQWRNSSLRQTERLHGIFR